MSEDDRPTLPPPPAESEAVAAFEREIAARGERDARWWRLASLLRNTRIHATVRV